MSTDDPANDESSESELPMAAGQREAEELLNTVLPFAEQQVMEHGGFLPYGAALTDDDDVVFVGADDSDDATDEEEIDEDALLDDIRTKMRAGAQRGDYLATAIVFDVMITTAASEDAESDEETAAIAAELDTVAGFCAMTFLPYSETQDAEGGTDVEFGDVIAQEGEHSVFG